MRPLVFALLAGCWTGSDTRPVAPEATPAPARPARRFEVTLARGACFGTCPVFKLSIRTDGRVDWEGTANVVALGRREGHIEAADLAAIDRAIDAARFFQRDRFGQLRKEPVCTHSGNTTSCSFTSVTVCSDTSHTTIGVTRGGKPHLVDNAHCSDEDAALNELEETILDHTHARGWIGR